MSISPEQIMTLAREAMQMGIPVYYTRDGRVSIGGVAPVQTEKKSNAKRQREYRIRRMAGDSGASRPKKWKEIRSAVFERDGHRCAYCGSDGGGKTLHCDHIVPLCKGGSNDMNNLATACWMCNFSKGGRLVTEWRPMHFKQFYRFSMENYRAVEQYLFAQ